MRHIAAFAKGANVHVSLDIDVLDPSIMRATATPAPNGLHLDQLMRILGTVESAAGDYYATDIMEYNPKKCAETGDAGERDASIQTMRTIFGFLTGK
jgi:arginase family enzyme